MNEKVLVAYIILFIGTSIAFASRSIKYRLIIKDLESMLTKKRMKFIGTDGSMGLKKGRIYNVVVWLNGKYICVGWYDKGSDIIHKYCPYSSYKKMMENWEVVR